MVSAGKVTLKFEVDIADLESKIARSKNAIAGLEGAANRTTQNLAKTGQQSTTTAVQFQTLSQGAINLTTSFAQTYTSLSNLQRAQTTVAAATVSLERSQDLIQRKMYQLQRERQKEVKDYEKIKLLSREVATAKRDEAVKVQKLADAQDQANDVNILFGINLLNVGFSAVQTGKSMLDMAKAAKDTASGVSGVTKSVGFLSKALTFLQAHPVFAIMTVAILAWEFAISGIIKDITGVDLSLQGLTKQALGIDKMKDSTEILGTEMNNVGQEIQFVSNNMTSAESSMITSIGNVGMSVKQLKADFTNIGTGIQELAAAWEGMTGPPSVLDYMKRLNSEISSITSDFTMLTEQGLGDAAARAIINRDIIDDANKLKDIMWEQVKAGTLEVEVYEQQLDLLDKQILLRQEALRQAEEQIKKERELAQAIEQTSKKNDKFKFGIDIAERIGFAADGIRKEILNLTGRDIGNVANSISFDDALRVANVEQYLSDVRKHGLGGTAQNVFDYLNRQGDWYARMQYDNAIRSYADQQIRANGYGGGRIGTNFFGTGLFKSSGATAAFQVARGSIRVAWREDQIRIEDRNRSRLRTGGVRNPNLPLWDPNAVTGGFDSISAFRADARDRFASNGMQSIEFVRALGGNPQLGFPNKAALNRMYSSAINQAIETRSLLARTGLSISMLSSRGDFGVRRGGGGFGNVSTAQANRMRASISNRYQAAVSATIAANQLTLKRAGQIDLLIGGFGLDSYYGSGLGLQQLQLDVQKQDELIQSIGLNRTEAFRIIDTQGRGRNEIDDRVRWTQRNESISTGVVVI